ncbi:MAG: hypothetical protein R3Y05_05955 [bacterium]
MRKCKCGIESTDLLCETCGKVINKANYKCIYKEKIKIPIGVWIFLSIFGVLVIGVWLENQ